MKKQLGVLVFILMGALILSIPALATLGPAVDNPTEPPPAAVVPAPEGKGPAGQPLNPGAHTARFHKGKIIDAKTKEPIAGALVTLGDTVVRTDKGGLFHTDGLGQTLKLRAPGYARKAVPVAALANPDSEIALTPFKVKGLYLTVYGAASKKLRQAALETIKANHLNALVIDVKGDRGFIPFKVDIPLAQEIGAQNTILIKDMPAFVAGLKAQGLYLIARIVVFKDDFLAAARPQWAVRRNDAVFRDREGLRWVDPFRHEVWDYNIAIAKAAAALGFDEIQFDYVRCPDKKGVVFSQPSTQKNRTAAITGFLSAAHQALAPTNVFVSADIFGYVPWNLDDTGVGQTIDGVLSAVDIVSPMLYPSGFQFGIPHYKNPVQHPYEIVYQSLKKAQERTGASPLRFRPWIQAFRDYAFHGGNFGVDRMRIQIKAVDDFGASGWMFWNPRNIYPKGNFASDDESLQK